MVATYECLYVCCISVYMYMYVFTAFKINACVPLYSAKGIVKGIDDVAPNKK